MMLGLIKENAANRKAVLDLASVTSAQPQAHKVHALSSSSEDDTNDYEDSQSPPPKKSKTRDSGGVSVRRFELTMEENNKKMETLAQNMQALVDSLRSSGALTQAPVVAPSQASSSQAANGQDSEGCLANPNGLSRNSTASSNISDNPMILPSTSFPPQQTVNFQQSSQHIYTEATLPTLLHPPPPPPPQQFITPPVSAAPSFQPPPLIAQAPSQSTQHVTSPLPSMHQGYVYPTTPYPDFSARIRSPAVPDAIRDAIWAGKFVDFYDVLYPNAAAKRTKLPLSNNTCLELITEGGKDLSQIEWVMAFSDYKSIYTQKCPAAVVPLEKYGRYILEMMRKGWNWKKYDLEFRMSQLADLTPWDVVRTDLVQLHAYPLRSNAPSEWRDSMGQSATSSRGKFRGSGGSNERSVPLGYCVAHHTKGDSCKFPRCIYSHKCPVQGCGGEHTVYHHSRDSARTSGGSRSKGRGKAPHPGATGPSK